MEIEEIKYLGRLEHALEKAYKRLNDQVRNLNPYEVENNNYDDIFASVVEVIMWINIINQWHWDRRFQSNYEQFRNSDPYGKLIEPLRYCFNEIKHNTRLIEIQKVEILSSMFGRARFSLTPFGATKIIVVWSGEGLRPDEQLKPQDKELKKKYLSLLKGTDVLQTLNNVILFLLSFGKKYNL